MKPWMKILVWFGLGAGLGFFAGQQVGKKQGEKEYEQSLVENTEAYERAEAEANEALDGYSGDSDEVYTEESYAESDDPEMPTEEDIAIDPDIPQLHPEHLVPEIIGEEEYNLNIWQYDLETLLFYEMDEVLFNERTQSIIENPDDVIGIGTLFEFGGDPNNPVDTIYVKNDTFGTLFRIDRIDAAFCDAVDGTCGPDDDDEETDEE